MKEKLFDAVIFDLDGVITQTALVHSAAWKEMFDGYLRYREEKYDEPFREFSHEDDYLPFVDGKPRYKGVGDFLTSRGIDIPEGDPSDADDKETVCGLGNRKNTVFNEIIDRDGVGIYESTVEFIRQLKAENYRIGVASSSKNCKAVLEATDLLKYFETRVDGIVSAEIGLKGKPEPDIFATACDNLGVKYHRAVIVEDAVSGVQAGQKGKFGLVIGLAREDNMHELKKNGADLVFEDMADLGGIEGVNEWFRKGLDDDQWSISYFDYDTMKEKSREALFTTGNGFFATRGAMEEVSANEINYPGTYMTGLFNRRKSKVGDREIENEDFVNFINWIPFSFRVEDGEWFNPNTFEFDLISRKLDFRTGLLSREFIVYHPGGKQTRVSSQRYVSMSDPHLAGIEYEITPLNYSSKAEIRTGINGNLINDGVERYRQLDQQHLEQLDQGVDRDRPFVVVRTNESHIEIACATGLSFISKGEMASEKFVHHSEKGMVTSSIDFQAEKGTSFKVQKVVTIFNNRDFQTESPLESALMKIDQCQGFAAEHKRSITAWSELWEETDIKITGDRYSQKLLRLHIYHLLVTASPFHKHLDAGIPARGLHGEAYRGHIFWDELYVFPFFVSHFPEIARSVLMYRYRRLDKAREYAKQHGYEGAMFPWQSGSDGREETQVVHLNPISGEWGQDHSSRQRHISIAVAYNIWTYYHLTGDLEFMELHGAEMFLDIVKFWASTAQKDKNTGKYSISGVMGPDEFQEKYPGAKTGGLKNNAYTNLMVSWCIRRALKIYEDLPKNVRGNILAKLELSKAQFKYWKHLTRNLQININKEGVIEQFEGYFDLKELDWDAYKQKYGNIHRLDRILKAEGKSPDEYKAAKQADLLMIFYILDEDEIREIITTMGHKLEDNLVSVNYDYYVKRTSHGSTLSRLVHASLARQAGHPEQCFGLFSKALESDYIDIQGGTTAEGIHVGVMGGTVLSALSIFAGLNWFNSALILKPFLPKIWESIEFNFHFRGELYHFMVSKDEVIIQLKPPLEKPVNVFIDNEELFIEQGMVVRHVL